MALVFESSIDLTAYPDNPAPKVVEQLGVVHTPREGEVFQFYIDPSDSVPGNKSSFAVGVLDPETGTWVYHDYDGLVWSGPGHSITGQAADRLSVKGFPGLGAYAVYKIAGKNLSQVVAPVGGGESGGGGPAPSLAGVADQSGGVAFTVSPPEGTEYDCWRVVLRNGNYSEEYITYESEFLAPRPGVSGTYQCWAVGYADDVQVFSQRSNVLEFQLAGEAEAWEPPYYSKEEIDEMIGQSGVTVDGALSDSSVNPVQNRVITGTMKSGDRNDKIYKLGFYLDANGDLCYD